MQGFVDASEKTQEVTAFIGKVQVFLGKEANAGRTGPADYYFRLRGRKHKGSGVPVILSGLEVSGDAEEDHDTLMSALEQATGEPYRVVILEMLPRGKGSPCCVEPVEWAEAPAELTTVEYVDDDKPARRGRGNSGGNAGLASAANSLAGSLVDVCDQLRRINAAQAYQISRYQDQTLDLALKLQKALADRNAALNEQWGKTIETVMERMEQPVSGLVAVLESKFKADAARATSEEDRQSERYSKGYDAATVDYQEAVSDLLDKLQGADALNADQQEQLKADIATQFVKLFGMSNGAKAMALFKGR